MACLEAGLADRHVRPFAAGRDNHDAAAQLPQTGHTCIAQHFLVSSVCDANEAAIWALKPNGRFDWL